MVIHIMIIILLIDVKIQQCSQKWAMALSLSVAVYVSEHPVIQVSEEASRVKQPGY